MFLQDTHRLLLGHLNYKRLTRYKAFLRFPILLSILSYDIMQLGVGNFDWMRFWTMIIFPFLSHRYATISLYPSMARSSLRFHWYQIEWIKALSQIPFSTQNVIFPPSPQPPIPQSELYNSILTLFYSILLGTDLVKFILQLAWIQA